MTGNPARVPDDRERLSADDEAQRTADLFLAGALADQALAARRAHAAEPGTCANCGEACLPTAIYCDADCRDDHEARVLAQRRTAGGG